MWLWWWCGAGRQGRYNFPLVIFGLRAIVVVAVVDCKSQITRPLLTKPPLLPPALICGGAAAVAVAVAGDLAVVVGRGVNVVVVVGVGVVGVVIGVLPRGPPRGRLGLYVAQRPATREAGTLGFGCGCACGGGGAARGGGKGGRIANFSLPHGSKSAVVLALVLVLPRIRHAGGWNLALPRGQPRGRLGFYVAQRPATREAGT